MTDSASPATASSTAPAKPAKAPAPEDKPFGDFIPNLLIPAIAAEIKAYGGPEATISFEQGPMPVVGSSCWMVKGELPGGRRFPCPTISSPPCKNAQIRWEKS